VRGLIFRYLFGELAGSLVSGILIFSGILLVNILFKAADLLFTSGIQTQHILDLILSLIPHLLTMTTPMSLMLALLLGYGRLAEQNELVALTASGINYRRIFAPGVTLSILLTLFMLFMENVIAPRANHLEREAKLSIIRDSAVVGLEEGVFNDRFPGHVIYIRNIEPGSGELQGIVINRMKRSKLEMTILSRRGKVEIDPEFRFLRLRLFGGTVYVMGGVTHTVGTFTHATLSLDIHEMVRKLSRGESRMKAYTTGGLAQAARKLASDLPRDPESRDDTIRYIRRLWREFYFRQAVPATCFAIPWLAIPLGIWTRSGRKSLAFGLSLVSFFGYYLLLAFGKSLIKNGLVSPGVGSWMPVAVLLVAGLFLTLRITRT
jgi:lipopolysaccharide export system permease protein